MRRYTRLQKACGRCWYSTPRRSLGTRNPSGGDHRVPAPAVIRSLLPDACAHILTCGRTHIHMCAHPGAHTRCVRSPYRSPFCTYTQHMSSHVYTRAQALTPMHTHILTHMHPHTNIHTHTHSAHTSIHKHRHSVLLHVCTYHVYEREKINTLFKKICHMKGLSKKNNNPYVYIRHIDLDNSVAMARGEGGGEGGGGGQGEKRGQRLCLG